MGKKDGRKEYKGRRKTRYKRKGRTASRNNENIERVDGTKHKLRNKERRKTRWLSSLQEQWKRKFKAVK